MDPTVSGQTELRIRVAELCGWEKFEKYPTGLYGWTRESLQDREAAWVAKDGLKLYPVPDYPNDLNAIAGAETWIAIDPDAATEYVRNLHDIAGSELWGDLGVVRATAEERCRAFVATMEALSVPKEPKSSPATGVLAEASN